MDLESSRMDRPRNRQPRQGQRGRGNDSPRGSRGSPATPQQAAGTVPSIQQVRPGASVFIVLKDDQPTGEETSGIVQNVLTRGNHPRGIKVRLLDGQVGRVQRLSSEASPAVEAATAGGRTNRGSGRPIRMVTDVRYDDDNPAEPPTRSLADFLPPSIADASHEYDTGSGQDHAGSGRRALVKCPLCENFEGDEPAVSFHIDQDHPA